MLINFNLYLRWQKLKCCCRCVIRVRTELYLYVFVIIFNLQDEYENLCQKIEDAVQHSVPLDISGDYAAFSHLETNNHPTVIKVAINISLI